MLTCTLAAGYLAALAVIRKKPVWGILAGVFIGVLSLIRPMDGLVVGALLGILLLFLITVLSRLRPSSDILLGRY